MRIHPNHQPQASRMLWLLAGALVLQGLILWLPIPQAWQGVSGYLPLHLALETFSIAIASMICAISWSVRGQGAPSYVALLCAGFLGVALFDFSHTASYVGMPDFVTPNTPDKAIWFWLLARLVSALALLSLALPKRLRSLHPPMAWLLWGVLGCVLGAHAVIFWAPQWLPPAFVSGQGLTRLKIGFEYALAALFLLTAALLVPRLARPQHTQTSGLLAAVCLLALSEIFFTQYNQVTDLYNLSGHLYKVLAYGLLYRVLFEEVVRHPYTQLRRAEDEHRSTLQALPDLLFELDSAGRYLQVHAHHHEKLSALPHALLGKTVTEVMPAAQAQQVLAALRQAQQQGSAMGALIELPVLDGSHAWFELSVSRKACAPGQNDRFLLISRDVTQRQKDQETLRKLSVAVEQSPVTIVITDLQARIEYVNQAFTRSSGYTEQEALGQNPRILQSGKTPASTYQAMWNQLKQGKPWQGEIINRGKNGREYTELVHISAVRDSSGAATHYLAHKEDITERKQAAERIQRLSHHDALTGLPNRSLVGEQFQRISAQEQELALLWIDLDHFKEVNDALGHNMGDLLLLEVTRRLRANLKVQDLLSRQSGDDFFALLPATSQDGAAALAQRLLQIIAQPIHLGQQEIVITCSIGIAVYPHDARQFDQLLQNAEAAMYRAKDEGRNNYHFFTQEMQAHAARTLALSSALKQALTYNELRLVYQPQMDLASGRVIGMEALLRWESAHWGMVSPAEFIPLAEDSGYIIPIGQWVLQTAIEQLQSWLTQGLAPLTMAVNLSALQFHQPELPAQITQLLQTSALPSHYLELELTEAMALKKPELALQQMQAFSAQGIQLSIDDFGTGYSSLSRLKAFPIHKLKIDQSFVRDLESDPGDQAIVNAIIQMAHSLGLKTIAEGVETAEQLELLRQQGCDEIQGYYFSRPLAPQDIPAFIARQR